MILDCNHINDNGGNQQIKRQRSFATQQAKTIGGIGGAGNNGDSGCKVQYWTEVARCNAYMRLLTAMQKRLYDTDASQVTRDITSGGTHHHPRHDRRCDATCTGQPEDADHSPVLRLSRTGRQISRPSWANAGVQFSTWLTMVLQTKS